MCHYDGQACHGGKSSQRGRSPDRMDALVWALADLFAARANPRIRKL
jgi:phage terminase large subunit-like protein